MRILYGFLILGFIMVACKNFDPGVLNSLAQKEIVKGNTDSCDYEKTNKKPDVTFNDLIVGNTVISSDIFELKTVGGVIFQFNQEENDRLGQKSGTNYNELADDINFYSMGVYNLLVRNHIPVYMTDKRFIRIKSDSSAVTIDTRRYDGIVGWKILLVDSIKPPRLFNSMNLDQFKLDAYFTPKKRRS